MKYVLLLFLLSLSFLSFAKKEQQIDSLNFCGVKYAVPADCSTNSKRSITCDDAGYAMQWEYTTEEKMMDVSQRVIKKITRQHVGVKREAITCYLFGKKAEGWLLSYRKDKGTAIHYRIICSGIANNQAVVVNLYFRNAPATNADIPEFPRQIITIEQ